MELAKKNRFLRSILNKKVGNPGSRFLTTSGVSWVIFRKYIQVNDLDSKLKSHGLLRKSDGSLPSKLKWKTKYERLSTATNTA